MNIAKAEQQREHAESDREQAEARRETSEDERASAEDLRQLAEEVRLMREELRESAEVMRESADQARGYAEELWQIRERAQQHAAHIDNYRLKTEQALAESDKILTRLQFHSTPFQPKAPGEEKPTEILSGEGTGEEL